MNFRKRPPNTNSTSGPNILLALYFALTGPDPDSVWKIIECPPFKANRTISKIGWVNSVKNFHVAGAMKIQPTAEVGFCYQSKETTVPPSFPPACACVVAQISLSVLEELSKRFIGCGRSRNYDVQNLKAFV